MKKLKFLSIALFIILALALTLTACGEQACQHRDADDDSLCDKCGEAYTDGKDVEDEHVHSFTEKNVDEKYKAKSADCENAASYYYTCACGVVGENLFSIGEAKGHTPGEWVVDKEATCAEEGKQHKDCTVCGIKTDEEAIAKLTTHTPGEWVVDKAATCAEEGKQHKNCTVCGIKTDEEAIAKLTTHTPGEWVVDKEATCAEEGKQHKDCTVCGVKMQDKTVAKLTTHTPVTDPRVEPTFTNTGLTEGSHCGVCNKVFVEQEIIPMRPSKSTLTSKALTQNGTNLDARFANNVTTFNFSEDITVTNNGIWIVSLDIYGMQTVATKMVPLNEGVNTFYIYVTNPDQSVTTYTVSIYRNHMYTVKFNSNGGTTIQSRSVEEGYLTNEPIAPTKAGYTFVGWDYDFTTPITANITANASWNANTDTAYKVEYYLENVNKNGYDLIETINLTGTTDTTANADKKAFEHFVLNTSIGILSGNINADGTLVLKVYYTRNAYTVATNDTSAGTVTNSGTYAYDGKTVTFSASVNKLGYMFAGWYSGTELLSTNTTYTEAVSRDIEARFVVAPEMQNFNFTSTSTSCSITGIKDKTVTEIIVPDYVTSISQGAFTGCSNLESITLPFVGGNKNSSSASSSMLFGYIFGKASYDNAVSTEQYYSSSYSARYYIPSRLRNVTITEGNILYGAFQNCDRLVSVTIGNSVTTIGERAFSYCNSLVSVTIGNGVTTIGERAFLRCESLASVVIGNGVTTIGDSAFNGCYSLESVLIPDSVTTIGEWAFTWCYSLVSVTIGNSVTTIGEEAFYFCYKLVEVINHSSLNITKGLSYYGEIGCYALEVHKGESKIVNNNGYLFITSDGVNYLLGYTGDDKNLVLPDSYNGKSYEIYKFAFYYRDDITSVVIPDSVTSIGSSAFEYCRKLVEVVNHSSLNITKGSKGYGYIGYYALEVHKGESKIVNNNGYLFITSGGVNYLVGYTGTDKNLVLPDSYNGESYEIYKDAFYERTDITSVVIPDSVTTIGEGAFYNCTSLVSVTIPDSVTAIGSSAFSHCNSLVSVVIPDSVTAIGDWAFASCDSLESIKYRGTASQWNAISKGSYWGDGTYYTMTYNYEGD